MAITIAVVSTALPPSPSGQAIVLERLLRKRNARYWFFSGNPETIVQAPKERRGEYRLLRPLLFGLSMRNLPGPIGNLNAHLGAMKPIRIRAAEIIALLGGVKPDIVIGCSGDPFDLPASALVAKKFGARFIAYLFDDPIYQWPAGRVRNVVRQLERRWSQLADHVICPNEGLALLIGQRTGREPVVIRNPKDDTLDVGTRHRRDLSSQRPVRLFYSGAISESQGDALSNLAEVVRRANGRYELEIFTQQPQIRLVEYGITGAHIRRRSHVDARQIAVEREKADVLFLPLSFHSPIQNVLMTSSPGKLGEYLAAQRPVLVHAPKDSFLSNFMRTHRAGKVVDTPTADALGEALEELVENGELRESLISCAIATSELFSERDARDRFWKMVETRGA